MTPNEIVREIVTRLQLGGGLNEDQTHLGSEWRARVKSYNVACRAVWNFESLDHVAEAIRAVGDGRTYSVEHVLCNGGDYRASVGDRCSYLDCTAFGATEAEALTRALHVYLRANKIGEEHLAPEPEEPWIDVSESVSTANLPIHGRECQLEFQRTGKVDFPEVFDSEKTCWPRLSVKPKALGGSVVKWRYAK